MTATATRLPIGTRVRVVNFGQASGLTGVVTAATAQGFDGWTFVALDRRMTAEEVDQGYPNESLVALPAPTVSLVKVAPVAMVRASAAIAVMEAEHADAERAAARITHLEEMLAATERIADDQAKLIRDQKAERDQLRGRLELATNLFEVARRAGARALGEATELRSALRQAQDRAQTASDAAEEYRLERNAARVTLDSIARLVDPTGG